MDIACGPLRRGNSGVLDGFVDQKFNPFSTSIQSDDAVVGHADVSTWCKLCFMQRCDEDVMLIHKTEAFL